MSDQLTLSAEARERNGKGASRALRNSGRVPAVIYGNNEDPASIHIEEKLLMKALHTAFPPAVSPGCRNVTRSKRFWSGL